MSDPAPVRLSFQQTSSGLADLYVLFFDAPLKHTRRPIIAKPRNTSYQRASGHTELLLAALRELIFMSGLRRVEVHEHALGVYLSEDGSIESAKEAVLQGIRLSSAFTEPVLVDELGRALDTTPPRPSRRRLIWRFIRYARFIMRRRFA